LNIPRFTEMPNCEWYAQGQQIRIFRRPGEPDVLEMLYIDGLGNPFWGPVPIVTETESNEGEK